jgi:hypothetical protein
MKRNSWQSADCYLYGQILHDEEKLLVNQMTMKRNSWLVDQLIVTCTGRFFMMKRNYW